VFGERYRGRVHDALATLVLVFLAELGDKSQIVLLGLAARYRSGPVLTGALVAFAALNTLAVTVGAAAHGWVPRAWVLGAVAVLFGVFGVTTLVRRDGAEEDDTPSALAGGVFWGTLSLVFVAELGDKTQLVVGSLAADGAPLAVWVGGTLALGLTSGLAVWAGAAVVARLPKAAVRWASGGLFLAFGAMAAARAIGAVQ